MFVTCGESILPWKIILVVYLFVGCCSAVLAADTISGVASNQTLGLPAAGDEVILFRIDQGMHEEGRAKTDAQGSFSFSLHGSDKLHVVRVVHQGVNYDQRISAGEA